MTGPPGAIVYATAKSLGALEVRARGVGRRRERRERPRRRRHRTRDRAWRRRRRRAPTRDRAPCGRAPCCCARRERTSAPLFSDSFTAASADGLSRRHVHRGIGDDERALVREAVLLDDAVRGRPVATGRDAAWRRRRRSDRTNASRSSTTARRRRTRRSRSRASTRPSSRGRRSRCCRSTVVRRRSAGRRRCRPSRWRRGP